VRLAAVLVTLAAVAVVAMAPAARASGIYEPATDVGPLYSTTLMTGAQAYWKAGFTGKGIDVAVVDSGVAPVPGLDGADKLVHGPRDRR
jgi:serine protease AprX